MADLLPSATPWEPCRIGTLLATSPLMRAYAECPSGLHANSRVAGGITGLPIPVRPAEKSPDRTQHLHLTHVLQL